MGELKVLDRCKHHGAYFLASAGEKCEACEKERAEGYCVCQEPKPCGNGRCDICLGIDRNAGGTR